MVFIGTVKWTKVDGGDDVWWLVESKFVLVGCTWWVFGCVVGGMITDDVVRALFGVDA